jgi:hypothetical protein
MTALDGLFSGRVYRFAEWPNPDVPAVAAGVYTIFNGDQFIYVGMAGRGMRADEIGALDEPVRAKGLKSRLKSHASGRRSGDQFCVYICDRFVVPTLSSDAQARIGEGTLLLDKLTRHYIHERLSYRFITTSDGGEAFGIERGIQGGDGPAGPPFLNPL